MRSVLPASLCAAFFLMNISGLYAQKDRFAYAITDLSKEGSGWNALRRLDLQTGQYSDVLLNGTDRNLAVYDALTRKQLSFQADALHGTSLQAPFATGVAAAAFDRKNNRLYYTPMYIDQLRYIDLKTMKVHYVTEDAFTGAGHMHKDGGKIITRMVIAPDGNGYAISNDAQIFIRFSTGKKINITRLGSLVDDPGNKGVSIHNTCTSAGGDMISDDEGNLFILSARNQVFKVNTETKVATFLGPIKNLPAKFTVNGAVVDNGGALLVSSAVDGTGYYQVDPRSWTATPFEAGVSVYRSSDLANSNYLRSKKMVPIRPELQNVLLTMAPATDKFAKLISVYPNPVTSDQVSIQFNKIPDGDYTIELTDILGRTIMQKRVTVNNEDQVQTLSLSRSHARGTYLVKVFDREKQSVFTQKVLVQ